MVSIGSTSVFLLFLKRCAGNKAHQPIAPVRCKKISYRILFNWCWVLGVSPDTASAPVCNEGKQEYLLQSNGTLFRILSLR